MRFAVFMFVVVIAFGLAPARADQRDPRLDGLFQVLKTASPLDAPAVRRQIADIWADAPSDTVDLLIDRAETMIEDGDDAAAATLLNAVVDLAPHFAHGYALRGGLNLALAETEKARADLERAIALEPRHFQARLALAALLARSDDTEAAYDMLRATLLIDPQNASAMERMQKLQPEIDSQEI
ncbi:MAG: hypothetical protein AAF224_04900 [Pseudomonadota bacterium]